MIILLDFNSIDHGFNTGPNQFIEIISEETLANIELSSLYLHRDSQFVLKLKSEYRSELLRKVNNYVFLMFHKDYHHHHSSPILAIESSLDYDLIKSDVQGELISHGFDKNCIIYNGVCIEDKYHEFICYSDISSNKEEINRVILNHNSKIICSDYQELQELLTEQNELLNSSKEIKYLFYQLKKKCEEIDHLKVHLTWQNLQIENYKSYLEVLKIRVSQGTLYGIYMRCISIINKLGPIRKLAKFIHSLVFK